MRPQTINDLQTLLRATPGPVRPRGGGSKPALSAAGDDTAVLDLGGLRGLIEYEPDEYTFTAYAGTPVAEIAAELAAHGQYLPCDPLLADAGATLGGTVAANTAGSGRYRYGGVRDFLLGVRFVDGQGRLVRGGGKVVKNAAGFDLPKFFVGSLGRYGVLTEVTFKVFPQPRAYVTLRLGYVDLAAALQATFRLATQPFEMDALDLLPVNGRCTLLIRLGGLPAALPERVARLTAFLTREGADGRPSTVGLSLSKSGAGSGATNITLLETDADAALWRAANAAAWVPEGAALVKVPLAPRQAPLLDAALGAAPRRYSCGGSVAWVATADPAALGATLAGLGLAGLQLTGSGHRDPVLGVRRGVSLARRVQRALDPEGRFVVDG